MATKKSQRAMSLVLALVFLFSTLAFTGAVIWQIFQDGDESSEVSQTNQTEGATMLEDFEPIASVDELQKIDRKAGNGAQVKVDDTVIVHYTGALAATGEIFQSSREFGQPIPLELDSVIKGWQEGIPGMKVGGIRRLVIPYEQAYGAQGRPDGGIPPKADLVFDVEVVEIQ